MEDSDFDCYLKNKRRFFAFSLIAFGLHQFKSSYLIQNIEKLKQLTDRLDENRVKNKNDDDETKKSISEFAFHHLIDSIKISIFFENYLKAILLDNSILVHILKQTNTLKNLYTEQKNRPIQIDELLALYSSKNSVDVFNESLTNQTLQFSTLIYKKNYVEPFQLEGKILHYIKKFNDYRNRLHFNHNQKFITGQSFIKDMYDLIKFSDSISEKIKPYTK